jgi:CheY-like chemotaxis protein
MTEKLLITTKELLAIPETDEMPLKGINILLVEDNQINVFVAQSFLEGWGATIDVAENGQEALDKLDPNYHQLVLMDLHMPVMDGYEAINKIREQGIRIPIIALTASLPSEIEEEVKGLGIDDMVLKPFEPNELFKKVAHFTIDYAVADSPGLNTLAS